MTSFGKATIAVAGIGTVGGGVGLGIHLLNNNPTISSRLTSEGFELATVEADWTKLFAAHNQLKAPTDNVFKDESTNKNWQWLEGKCKEALNKEDKDDANYLLARQWCVKETDIKAILRKTSLKILDTTGATDNETHWARKLTDLKENAIAIKDLEISKNKDSIAIDDIKGKCTPILDIKTTNKDFNKNIDLAKKWCSISNTTN